MNRNLSKIVIFPSRALELLTAKQWNDLNISEFKCFTVVCYNDIPICHLRVVFSNKYAYVTEISETAVSVCYIGIR